jgi:hypothetical protein
MFQTLILKLTHKIWNRKISKILCSAYNNNIINSNQLHELTAQFDPSQKHTLY